MKESDFNKDYFSLVTDFELCLDDPYLLDNTEKVEWANRIGRGREWRLGDSCYFRPVNKD